MRFRPAFALAGLLTIAASVLCCGWSLIPSTQPPTHVKAVPPVVPKGVPAIPDVPAPAPRYASEGVVEVVATLPDAHGAVGASLWRRHGIKPVSDDEISLGLGRAGSPRTPPDWEFTDGVHWFYDSIGFRPANHAELIAQIDPELAHAFLYQESNWRERDALRGLGPSDPVASYADQLRLADALGDRGRFYRLEAEVAATPEAERSQMLWDRSLELMAEGGFGWFGFAMATDMLVDLPEVNSHHHEIIAAHLATSRYNHTTATASDLMLRVALRDGDDAWAAFWWAQLQLCLPIPEGTHAGWTDVLQTNQDELAGVALARVGPASTWEDGLRRAAVMCPYGEPLEAQIEVHGGAWTTRQSHPFLECVLRTAEPLAPAGQRAQLVVVQHLPPDVAKYR